MRREMEIIFRNKWIFAGLACTLKKRNAFFTRVIGGVFIVVTTPDGTTIKAFENACAHRQMPIQTESFGNRGLVCPYHAWSYACEDGRLKGLSNPHLYEMRVHEKDAIGLREFAVQVVGELVFVNLANEPIPFESQFSNEFVEKIRDASSYFDKTYAYSKFRAGYNWKLNFENVMDYNHVPFIHSNSFKKLLKEDPNAQVRYEHPVDVEWDKSNRPPSDVTLSELSFTAVGEINLKPRWYSDLIRRYGTSDAYYNWFIFPNVNFCSVAGEHFLIQQYMPVTPDILEYHLWVMPAERLSLRTNFTALLRGLMISEKQIIDEDSVFMEQLQASLNPTSKKALHGAYEHMVYRFGDWYSTHVLNDEEAGQ